MNWARSIQWVPMSETVRVGVTIRLDPPVVIVDQEQPVLGVGARDRDDPAQFAPRRERASPGRADRSGCCKVTPAACLGWAAAVFTSSAVSLCHDRQRLLAEHVFARLQVRSSACSKWTWLGEAICTAPLDGSARSPPRALLSTLGDSRPDRRGACARSGVISSKPATTTPMRRNASA